ncbi:MAG: TetR/AcrR family transcriptional regulator [Candidatus Methylomirabilia bacterium]
MEHGQKRAAVMQATLELVGEHGFHGSPMALIAERAGVAAGTIYRFFESKDILIKEVYASLEKQILAAVTADYPARGPVRDRFLHIGRQLVGFFITSPLQFRFLEQFHNSPYGVACRRDKVFGKNKKNIIIQLLEEARDQQVIKDLPLPILMALTFGPLVDVCRDHVLEFITLDDRLIERTVEACWDAVRR